jgi:myo-inositol-1-phosphate synthase
MAPNPNNSGYTTPETPVDGVAAVHSTAARRPYTLTVRSENTQYSDEFITSTFRNRGAAVTVADGQFIINPTTEAYQFQTKRTPSKTG